MRVTGFLAVAVPAGLMYARALAAVAVVLAVLAAGLLLPWLTLRRVRAWWHYPLRRGQVGKPVAVRLCLESRLPWSAVGLVVRGGWADAGALSDPLTAAVGRLPGRGKVEAAMTAVPQRRGVYPLSPGALATGFPFGFWQARRVESDGQLLVWPEVVPLELPVADAVRGRGQQAGAQRAGEQAEFFGARPYRRGESLRQVHWKQSARHDELIVWESRAAGCRSVVLLVETAAQVHARHAGGDSLEKTLSVGASLASGLVERGLAVTLAFGLAQVFAVGNRPQLESALDAMARFEAGSGAGQGELLERVPRGEPAEATWVVTTLAGWERAGRPSPQRRAVLIDEREAAGERIAAGEPRTAPLVPLADPGHGGLRAAWKEVSLALEALV